MRSSPASASMLALALPLLTLQLAAAKVYDIERDFGAVPYEPLKPATAQSKVAFANGAAFNTSLNQLQP